MVYITAKFLEASGLAVIFVGFIVRFPRLIDMKILLLGGLIFLGGWVLDNKGFNK